jgi:hypothetical protein
MGTIINAATREPFTYKDRCVAHGPHMGYDPEAAQQVGETVTSFMRTMLKPN